MIMSASGIFRRSGIESANAVVMDDYALVGNAVPLFSVVHINVIDQLTDHAPCNRGSVSIAPDSFKKEIHIHFLAVSLFSSSRRALIFPAASPCSCSYRFAIFANRASSILPDTLSSYSLSKSISSSLSRASSASSSRCFALGHFPRPLRIGLSWP